jgi:hypothetical protein
MKWLFGKDYWRMTEQELGALAEKYNIEGVEYENDTGHVFFNRAKVINALTHRDSHRHARWAFLISVVSIFHLSFSTNAELLAANSSRTFRTG